MISYTESALSGKIKESWRRAKTSDFPVPGDYFYQIIDKGVLFGKEIEIPLTFFNRELREILDKQDSKKIQKVIFRAIREIAQENFGSRNLKDQISWRLV